MSQICPACAVGRIVSETWPKEFEYNGCTLVAEYTEEFCDACGTLMQGTETIRRNARNVVRAKNESDRLLCGEQIRTFRESFAISQKLAADLFGGGPTAFAKYEADDISHNVAMDRLLRLCIRRPDNLLQLADESEVALPAVTVQKIRARLEAEYQAMISEAYAALQESALPRQEERSANDNVFYPFERTEACKPAKTSYWAVDLAAA